MFEHPKQDDYFSGPILFKSVVSSSLRNQGLFRDCGREVIILLGVFEHQRASGFGSLHIRNPLFLVLDTVKGHNGGGSNFHPLLMFKLAGGRYDSLMLVGGNPQNEGVRSTANDIPAHRRFRSEWN